MNKTIYFRFVANYNFHINFVLMIDCKVYIAFHQNGEVIPKDESYSALQVGKLISNLQLKIENDATGENISAKNDFYSELTGWYWIWKNQKHDYIGTAHYRRYFTAAPTPLLTKVNKKVLNLIGLKKKRHGLFYVKNSQNWIQKILTLNEIQSILNEFDVILPQKKKFKYSVQEQYKRRHNINDLMLTRQILGKLYPEYLLAFDEALTGKEMYAFNMFIMPWAIFNNYMKWLFSILFELEKVVHINRNDKYQKRIGAFMAERLQTVWFQKNKFKVKELPVLYFKNLKTEHF